MQVLAEFFVNVLIMLVSAMILGEVFHRLKLPALVGHLLAGVIIGPSLFNIVQVSEELKIVTDLAVFFLMFLAGLELHPEEIRKAGRNAVVVSIAAFTIPFVTGAGAANALGLPIIPSLFIGLTLAITAVPVSSIVLMEFGMLKSKIGTTVVTAGVINDILSLITLAIILQLSTNEGEAFDYGAIGFSIFKIAAFLGGIVLLDFVLNRTLHWLPAKVSPLFGKLKTREAAFGIMLVSALSLSMIAENVGLHFVIGTFFAGLIIYSELIGKENFERVYDVFSAITFGLLSPIFFAFIGIEFNARSIIEVLPLFLALLGVAIAAKIGGGYIGARAAGFSRRESRTVGYLMNSRGMVELVIATIGLELGIIDITLFSVVVAVGFITTIMAPIMARISLRHSIDSSDTEK